MNLKNIFKKMDINDLKWICQKVNVECNSNKSSIIKKLLSPLKKSYNMNISDPIQATNEIILRIMNGIYDDNLESGKMMAQRYIKNIIYQDVKEKINYLLEKVYRNRLHFVAFKDRLILISTHGKEYASDTDNYWIKYLNIENNISCIFGIQSALDNIKTKYPDINDTDTQEIAILLENYCNKNT